MNDKELLEMAAKSAGIVGLWHDRGQCIHVTNCAGLSDMWWRPLEDDGDALRLAVALSLVVRHNANRMEAYQMGYPSTKVSILFRYDPSKKAFEQTEKQSASRRAIVESAAKIGMKMP